MMKIALESKGVAAGLTVNDLQRSMKFYVDGLGFEVGDKHEENGRLVFVMLKGGNAELGLGQDDFAKGKDRKKGVGLRLWINTKQDLVEISAQVKAAGFALDHEVMETPWGQKAFSVTDPDGFAITVGAER